MTNKADVLVHEVERKSWISRNKIPLSLLLACLVPGVIMIIVVSVQYNGYESSQGTVIGYACCSRCTEIDDATVNDPDNNRRMLRNNNGSPFVVNEHLTLDSFNNEESTFLRSEIVHDGNMLTTSERPSSPRKNTNIRQLYVAHKDQRIEWAPILSFETLEGELINATLTECSEAVPVIGSGYVIEYDSEDPTNNVVTSGRPQLILNVGIGLLAFGAVCIMVVLVIQKFS